MKSQQRRANIIEQFISWLESERRYSPLTVRNYRRDVDDFLAHLGTTREEFDPRVVERTDIEEWCQYLFEVRKLATSSVNRSIASIRTLWHWMVRHDYTSHDIVSPIKGYKVPKRLPVYVPESRMEDVVELVGEELASDEFERVRNALIVLLLYTSGLRLAEITSANMGDISADMRSIRVVGKGRKTRIQPLHSSVVDALKKYFLQISLQNICTGQKKALILSKKGERISQRSIERIVDNTLKSAGIRGKSSPHVLRHTYATHLLNEGADLREIQELMGHSSLRATEVYTHLDIERLKEAYHNAHPRGREEERGQERGQEMAIEGKRG